ncbi:hypothetical protein ACVCSM_005249, partial [Escherichia coli]
CTVRDSCNSAHCKVTRSPARSKRQIAAQRLLVFAHLSGGAYDVWIFLPMSGVSDVDFFSKSSPAMYDKGKLLKLNSVDFFFFGEYVSSTESPVNSLHPHYRFISLN